MDEPSSLNIPYGPGLKLFPVLSVWFNLPLVSTTFSSLLIRSLAKIMEVTSFYYLFMMYFWTYIIGGLKGY